MTTRTTVLFVVGLPGSGKIQYLQKQGYEGYARVPKVKATVVTDRLTPEVIQHCLMVANIEGRGIAIASDDLCDPIIRFLMETVFRQHTVCYTFFEPNPHQCWANVLVEKLPISNEEFLRMAFLYTTPHGYLLPVLKSGSDEVPAG